MYSHVLDWNKGVPKTPNLFTKKIPVKTEFLAYSFAVFGDMGHSEGLGKLYLAFFKIVTLPRLKLSKEARSKPA